MEHYTRASPVLEPPSTFPIELAFMIATWVEVLLYGIYTCLFFESLYIMLKKRKTRTWSGKVFLIVVLLMYVVATTHIALGLYRLMRGFVWLRDTVGPSFYFFDIRRWDHCAHNLIICAMTWLGDGLVIYRCFIIWNQRYVIIILPSLLLLYTICLNATVLYWFRHPLAFPVLDLIPWMNTFYPTTFVQNILTTGLIVFKIVHQHRISNAAGVRSAVSRLKLMHVVRILIESAMVYTMQLLITIIFYFRHHNALYVMQYAMVPTIGIVFNLIAVRVHINESNLMKTTRIDNPTGISWWTDDHLRTTIELDRLPSRRMDEEAPQIQQKQNRAFAQTESLDHNSGHRRSI